MAGEVNCGEIEATMLGSPVAKVDTVVIGMMIDLR
jgi:hypothetical protein